MDSKVSIAMKYKTKMKLDFYLIKEKLLTHAKVLQNPAYKVLKN